MPAAPSYPWTKGKQAEYTCFVIEIEVAVDQNGTPWSNHKLQSQEDMDLTMEMDKSGQEHVAHALLMEAVKREALLEVLLKLSNDAEFKERVLDPAPDAQEKLVSEVSTAMMRVVNRVTAVLAPDAARAALDMVRQDPP